MATPSPAPVSIIPLFGHEVLRERLLAAAAARTLPQSLLLHGPTGVGKQRLALLVAQAIVCEREPAPCGACQHCRYALRLAHPDVIWVFPRPRPKDSETDVDDVKNDLALASRERAEAYGLYAPAAGSDGIFVSTIRFLARQASLTPALASRKVFVIGDADRMVPQEGSEYAANALLKLLEEPPADTSIMVTTSAVGALLPTIRSRLVSVRVPRVQEVAVRAFLADERVHAARDQFQLPAAAGDRVALAGGAPGLLLASGVRKAAMDGARRLLAAAVAGRRGDMLRLALVQGSSGARGAYSDLLDALTLALRDRMRDGVEAGDDRRALSASRAIDSVEDAKLLADGNVNPQLITARLLHDLSRMLA